MAMSFHIPGSTAPVEWSGEEPTEYTPVADPAAVMRSRLAALARKGSPAQREAAALLAAHGDAALVVLLRRSPLVPLDRRVRVLLEVAGCSAGEQVEMWGEDRSRVEELDPLPW